APLLPLGPGLPRLLCGLLCARLRHRSGLSRGRLLARRLLPNAHAAPRTLPSPGVGVGALPAHGQTPAVPDTPVRADVHQALDVHRHLAPKVTLDFALALQ